MMRLTCYEVKCWRKKSVRNLLIEISETKKVCELNIEFIERTIFV